LTPGGCEKSARGTAGPMEALKKRGGTIRFVSWNVRTITGRSRELAEALKKRRVSVACVQETKWKGQSTREIGEG